VAFSRLANVARRLYIGKNGILASLRAIRHAFFRVLTCPEGFFKFGKT
jgi:hypothetical protein